MACPADTHFDEGAYALQVQLSRPDRRQPVGGTECEPLPGFDRKYVFASLRVALQLSLEFKCGMKAHAL